MSGPAADIYKEVLDRVDTRPKKWRITTYDQAAECFRRWAEQNKAMRDTESFKQHIDTACKILEKAAGTNDFDDHTGILYTNVVEDSIFFALATKDEGYAISQLQRIAAVHNGHGRQRLVLSQICSRQIHHLVRSQGGSCGNVRS